MIVVRHSLANVPPDASSLDRNVRNRLSEELYDRIHATSTYQDLLVARGSCEVSVYTTIDSQHIDSTLSTTDSLHRSLRRSPSSCDSPDAETTSWSAACTAYPEIPQYWPKLKSEAHFAVLSCQKATRAVRPNRLARTS